VRVKILEIDSERRRLSLSVKRVEAAQAGQVAAGAAQGGGEGSQEGGEIGEVRDLGLSEDVFAGAEVNIEGSENLRAAVEEAQESSEAEPPARDEGEPKE
jgi:small subunit ribosomal protein S1